MQELNSTSDLPTAAIIGAISGWGTANILADPMAITKYASQLITDLGSLNVLMGSLWNAACVPLTVITLISTANSVLTGNSQGITFLGSTTGYLIGGMPGSIIGGIITSIALSQLQKGAEPTLTKLIPKKS